MVKRGIIITQAQRFGKHVCVWYIANSTTEGMDRLEDSVPPEGRVALRRAFERKGVNLGVRAQCILPALEVQEQLSTMVVIQGFIGVREVAVKSRRAVGTEVFAVVVLIIVQQGLKSLRNVSQRKTFVHWVLRNEVPGANTLAQ